MAIGEVGLRHPRYLMVFKSRSQTRWIWCGVGFCVYSTKLPEVPVMLPQTTKIDSPSERYQVPEAPDLPTPVDMGVRGAMPAASWCLRCPVSGFWASDAPFLVEYAKMVIRSGIYVTRRVDFRLLRLRTPPVRLR